MAARPWRGQRNGLSLITSKLPFADRLPARFREEGGRKAAGAMLALLIECVVLLAVLSLARLNPEEPKRVVALSTFSVSDNPQPAETPTEPSAKPAQQAPRPAPEPPQPAETPPAPPHPVTPPPAQAMIPLTRDQMASADIARLPAKPDAPAKQPETIGPANIGGPKDTPRTSGSGPRGEPLYAASWYREPYDDELRGYLSTAQGPGWGKIACRTVADFRVDSCVIVDEYPKGSGIARAALAASWQFLVRPPRVGGRVMVGEWVGILIDYDLRR